jgi:hypothetical protein
MVKRSTEERPVEVIIEVPKARKSSKYDISRVMAEMGRKGGQIGGKRRLITMTKEQRSEIASKAARARWKKP